MSGPGNPPRWLSPLGALSGVVFVAFTLLAPEPSGPGERASAEAIVQFYETSGQAIRTALVMSCVGYMFFVLFSATLTAHLRRVEGNTAVMPTVAIAAAVLIAAFQVAGTALWAAPSLVGLTGRDPAEVAMLASWGSLSQEALVVTASFWRALLLAAVGVAVIQRGALARWFGWITLALAVTTLVGPVGLGISAKNEVISAFGFGSYLAFHAWVALASLVLAVRLRRSPPPGR